MNSPVKTELKGSLGLGGLTLFGITYMTIITVFTTFGLVNQISGGKLPAAYAVALVAMLFTALSYGLMARRYPVAGSAYTYSQQAFGGGIGFLTGWVMLLDYIMLPLINFVLLGLFLAEIVPQVPFWVFTVIAIVFVWVLNVLGLTAMNRLSVIIIGLGVVLVAVFVVLGLRSWAGADPAPGLFDPLTPDATAGAGPIFAGAAILALSFLGFDAVSTLSEEAKNPTRDIPRAILLTTLVGGVIFTIVAWVGTLAYAPDWAALSTDEVGTAGVDAMRVVGGELLTNFFVAVYVAGALGSGMASQASVSRILYAMGRDGLLPKPFKLVSSRFGTPVFATTVVSLVAVLGIFLPLDVMINIISFGALTAFVMVNLAALKTFLLDRAKDPQNRPFNRFTLARVLQYVVAPVLGVGITVWLWLQLDSLTLIIGGCWLLLGLVIVAVVTGGFRRPVPKLDFSEQPTTRMVEIASQREADQR